MERNYYILDSEHRVVSVDREVWGDWISTADRKVDRTVVGDNCEVSTVFLSSDHRWGDEDGPPILFETKIFGGPLDQEMWRYSSWDDAKVGHAMAVKKAQEASSVEVER